MGPQVHVEMEQKDCEVLTKGHAAKEHMREPVEPW